MFEQIKNRYLIWSGKMVVVDVKEMIHDMKSALSAFNAINEIKKTSSKGPFSFVETINFNKAEMPNDIVSLLWRAIIDPELNLPKTNISLLGSAESAKKNIEIAQNAEKEIMDARQRNYAAFSEFVVLCLEELENAKSFEEINNVLNKMAGSAFGQIRTSLRVNFEQLSIEKFFVFTYEIGHHLLDTSFEESKKLGRSLISMAEKYIREKDGVVSTKMIICNGEINTELYASVKS
jgi:hypothetical protein